MEALHTGERILGTPCAVAPALATSIGLEQAVRHTRAVHARVVAGTHVALIKDGAAQKLAVAPGC